ncbi:MAG: NTP transferase domain-containing protein [Candidatus Saccharicenans sp.]
MKGLIIAAGKGERLSSICPVKPLLPVGGRVLIDWAIGALLHAGIKEIVVVTGYEGEQVENHLKKQSYVERAAVNFVRNEEWEKENGLSVYKAKDLLNEPFFLLMSDHIFDPEILKNLREESLGSDELILAVDYRLTNHPFVDLEDVTRVQVEKGQIISIGKGLTQYNAFDTGIFLCSPALFAALEESQRLHNNFTLSGGVRVMASKGKARVMDIGDKFWIDVDDQKAREKCEQHLQKAGRIIRP